VPDPFTLRRALDELSTKHVVPDLDTRSDFPERSMKRGRLRVSISDNGDCR